VNRTLPFAPRDYRTRSASVWSATGHGILHALSSVVSESWSTGRPERREGRASEREGRPTLDERRAVSGHRSPNPMQSRRWCCDMRLFVRRQERGSRGQRSLGTPDCPTPRSKGLVSKGGRKLRALLTVPAGDSRSHGEGARSATLYARSPILQPPRPMGPPLAGGGLVISAVTVAGRSSAGRVIRRPETT